MLALSRIAAHSLSIGVASEFVKGVRVVEEDSQKNSPRGVAWIVAVATLVGAIAELLKAIERLVQ